MRGPGRPAKPANRDKMVVHYKNKGVAPGEPASVRDQMLYIQDNADPLFLRCFAAKTGYLPRMNIKRYTEEGVIEYEYQPLTVSQQLTLAKDLGDKIMPTTTVHAVIEKMANGGGDGGSGEDFSFAALINRRGSGSTEPIDGAYEAQGEAVEAGAADEGADE